MLYILLPCSSPLMQQVDCCSLSSRTHTYRLSMKLNKWHQAPSSPQRQVNKPRTDWSPLQGSSEKSWDAERWSMGRDEAHLQQHVCSKWRTLWWLASTPQNHLHAQWHGLWHVRPLAASSWHYYLWSCLLVFQCHHLQSLLALSARMACWILELSLQLMYHWLSEGLK